MFATGVLTFYVAITGFRQRAGGVVWPVTMAAVSSIGVMVVVNFLIDSDFKWLLASFTLPWIGAIGLYRVERAAMAPAHRR